MILPPPQKRSLPPITTTEAGYNRIGRAPFVQEQLTRRYLIVKFNVVAVTMDSGRIFGWPS